MKKETCENGCCGDFFDLYDEDDDNYTIQRLKDIIKICEFLIEVEEHKKDKKKILDDILKSVDEADKKSKSDDESCDYKIYRYKFPKHPYYKPYVPWWDRVWF